VNRTIRYGDLLLGVEGASLFRHLLDEDDEFRRRRVDAIRRWAHDFDDERLSTDFDVPEWDVAEGYAAWAPPYDSVANALIDAEEPLVESVLRDVPAGVALDAACGTGRQARRLTASGHATVGIDASPEMLGVARLSETGATFAIGDLMGLPVADGCFDVPICSLALTHLTDPAPAIAELARVVRHGGRIVVTDAHPTFVTIQGQALFPTSRGLASVRNYVHLHGTYLRAFAAAGLEVLACLEAPMVIATSGMFAEVADAVTPLWDGVPGVLLWSLCKSSR